MIWEMRALDISSALVPTPPNPAIFWPLNLRVVRTEFVFLHHHLFIEALSASVSMIAEEGAVRRPWGLCAKNLRVWRRWCLGTGSGTGFAVLALKNARLPSLSLKVRDFGHPVPM